SARVHQQGRRGDGARFLGEFPKQLVDWPQVFVVDRNRPAVVEREADRPPRHRGSIANVSLWGDGATGARSVRLVAVRPGAARNERRERERDRLHAAALTEERELMVLFASSRERFSGGPDLRVDLV